VQVELCDRFSAPHPTYIYSNVVKQEVADQFVAAMASVVAAEDKALNKQSAKPHKHYTKCAVTGNGSADYADVRGIQQHSCRWLTALLQVKGSRENNTGWKRVARFSASHRASPLAQNGTVYIGSDLPCLNCFKAKGVNGKQALCTDCKAKGGDFKSRAAFESLIEEGLKTILGMYEVRLKRHPHYDACIP
jgi:hypothetical protein